MDTVRQTRHVLKQHNVDARHVLAVGATEEVTGTVGHVHMAVLILDDVTNIHYAMLPAPVTQLIAEVLPE